MDDTNVIVMWISLNSLLEFSVSCDESISFVQFRYQKQSIHYFLSKGWQEHLQSRECNWLTCASVLLEKDEVVSRRRSDGDLTLGDDGNEWVAK